MSKVILVCGKICSGKSYYAEKIKEKYNAVILSPDEATYDLIENTQGEFYDKFIIKLIDYLNKKAVEIVKAGANVIYERGLWSVKAREEAKDFFTQNGVNVELHYVNVSDEKWNQNIQERNAKIQAGNGGSNFYVDEGLKNKLLSKFEKPNENEVDVWINNI